MPRNLVISYSTAQCYRNETAQKIFFEISESWKFPAIALANTNWDGKLMQTLDTSRTIKHIPILFSGIEGIQLQEIRLKTVKSASYHISTAFTRMEL